MIEFFFALPNIIILISTILALISGIAFFKNDNLAISSKINLNLSLYIITIFFVGFAINHGRWQEDLFFLAKILIIAILNIILSILINRLIISKFVKK